MTPKIWNLGDRVAREVYLDDGTWMKLGDECLPGPLKYGVVIDAVYSTHDSHGPTNRWVYTVRWDDKKEQRLLEHGMQREAK